MMLSFHDLSFYLFFFNDTATTEIYTLSLHDALPICHRVRVMHDTGDHGFVDRDRRSEEHTSELQSHHDLVCRLLLEKKKTLIFFLTSIMKKKTKNKTKQE